MFHSGVKWVFDLCDDLTEEMVANNTEISWYGHANVVSGDYISAKSMYYNELLFSNVSINMSGEEIEIEDYNTDSGACFGKACIFTISVDRNFIQ